MLELVEGFLQHVLGVDLLHAQQVEHHVVRQVEGAVQRVGRALRDNGTVKPPRSRGASATFCFCFEVTGLPLEAVSPQTDSIFRPP